MTKFLVYGQTGWIGQQIGECLRNQNIEFEYGKARLEFGTDVAAEIEKVKPTHVINAAGLTGRPNVDWCEDHKDEVIRTNIIGLFMLADACHSRGVHLTTFASGCIYQYDEAHPIDGGAGFKEEDTPNFEGSFYSYIRVKAEMLLKEYPNVLILRLRMPIVSDLACERNFITKILTYAKIISIPNSMSVLPELLPVAITLALRRLSGPINFTNPGAISHNEILELCRTYVYPELTWSNFTVEEQNKILKAPRSNNTLNTSKIEAEIPSLLPIRESLIKYVFEPARERQQEVAAAIRSLRAQ